MTAMTRVLCTALLTRSPGGGGDHGRSATRLRLGFLTQKRNLRNGNNEMTVSLNGCLNDDSRFLSFFHVL